MARKQSITQPLPVYDLQSPENSVFALRGYAPIQDLNGRMTYEGRAIPLDEGGFDTAMPIQPSNIRSLFNGVETLATALDNSVAPHVYEPSTRTWHPVDGLSAGFYLPFTFRGNDYFIDGNFGIHRSSGTGSEPSSAVEDTNLSEIANVLGVSQTPTEVLEWQGRVWIVYDSLIMWSDVRDLSVWSSEVPASDITEETLAGHQTFNFPVRGLSVNNDDLYVFLQNGDIHRVRVLDANIQFGFIPLATSVDFVGGAIATYAGLYFLSHNAIFRVAEDSVQRVSYSHGTDLGGISSSDLISAVLDTDTIFWKVSSLDRVIAHDINRGFTYLADSSVDYVGEISEPGTTFDEVLDEFDQVNAPFDSFADPDFPTPVGLTDGSGGMGRIAPIALPDTSLICVNLIKKGQYKRIYVDFVSIPQLNDYRIRFKNSAVNAWFGPFAPDDFGVVQVQEVFDNGFDLEIQSPGGANLREVMLKFGEVSR